MAGRRESRSWVPVAAFVVLAGSWYIANVSASAAWFRTQRAADVRIVATGHEPVFTDLPTVWAWQQNLWPAMFGIMGAAILALLLRRASHRPWFFLAGALPVVVGRADHLHAWWAPGMGIDQWTFGAGVGIPGRLDLSHFGAGPSWALAAGTLLAVAAVLVPALCAGQPPQMTSHRQQALGALPYVGLLSVTVALAAGELGVDSSGDGSNREMLVAGAATALIALVVVWVAPERRFWSHVSIGAVAVGLVALSAFHPTAMFSTKVAAFGTAAGIAFVAGGIARRSGPASASARAAQPQLSP